MSWLLRYLVLCLLFLFSNFQRTSSSPLNPSPQSGRLCSSEESFALLHFKSSISINSSASIHCGDYAISDPKTDSWKEGSDCCSWDGVTCDMFTWHVTALHLGSSWLRGAIDVNSSLFLLHHLRELNLACNNFQGSRMWSKFGQFTYLTHLNLSSSYLSGPVPIEISQLSKLLSIDLSSNSLKLEQPNFVKILQNLTELGDLVLDLVDMSLVSPACLVNVSSSLISLSLRHNYLQGEFPNEILHLPFLQHLTLSGNFVLNGMLPMSNWSSALKLLNLSSTSFSGKLPHTIGNLINLNVLDLASCKFEGPIPASFWNLTQITFLNLRHNNFSGQFPDVFGNLNKVKYLDLSENNFTSELPLSAFNLTQLSSLDFSDNRLVGQLPSQVNGLSYLTKIRLFNNLLNGTIPSWLFTLPSLEVLGLGNNNFSGSFDQFQAMASSLKYFLVGHNEIQGPIPNSILKLVNLSVLDLSSNNFSGVLDIVMFSRLKNLKRVYLSDNNLLSLRSQSNFSSTLAMLEEFRCSSCNITEFPNFLSGSENLKFLDLSKNSIPGRISWHQTELWRNLFYLNLSYNLLTSFVQIPSMSLEYLDLCSNLLQGPLVPLPPSTRFVSVANNKLTGEIPSSFCSFNSIGYIDLSNNGLTGMIPQCLASYDELTLLDLRMNNLQGCMPQTFSMCYRLMYLDFNGNQLEGSFPPSLANCSSLEVIDVGNNMIDDAFPHWLAALPDLQILILRSNRFYGPIDNSITKFPFQKLRILDISHNFFTGLLPSTYFENFKALMGDDSHGYGGFGNVGDGIHPDSVILTTKGVEYEYSRRILNYMSTIDLSSNQFHGQIPRAVGMLDQLHSLNLSHNHLSGQIPSSLGSLSWLESLDLLSNKLVGEIPSQLVDLIVLSMLNLSYNRLVGPLPPLVGQFATFGNFSYIGNLGLCGRPMSVNCSTNWHSTSGWFDWKIILMGYGTGVVIGLSIGYIVFSKGKPQWFVSMVEGKQSKKVKRLNQKRRRN